MRGKRADIDTTLSRVPFHGVFHCNSNSMEISFCSHLSWSKVIAMKFSTWHNSCAVVTCAKFCSNMIYYNEDAMEIHSIELELRFKNCSWNEPQASTTWKQTIFSNGFYWKKTFIFWKKKNSQRAYEWTYNKSTLLQVMAWCHQAKSHYLSQCWQIYIIIWHL